MATTAAMVYEITYDQIERLWDYPDSYDGYQDPLVSEPAKPFKGSCFEWETKLFNHFNQLFH